MKSTLIIACGAIAHELIAVLRTNNWSHVDVKCLPAEWHNTPDKIAPAVRQKIRDNRDHYKSILIGYADCGTGGRLDSVIEEESVERLPGAHCYSFFAGLEAFEKLSNDELGTFYLTDYIAANFERLILQDLGILKHPELMSMYFGNYTKLMYLSQQPSPELIQNAEAAAATLKLEFEHVHTGIMPLEHSLKGINIVVE